MKQKIQIFRFTILIVQSIFTPITLANKPDTNCIEDFNTSKYPEMLVGYGEGMEYIESKLNAIRDAISILGQKLKSKSEVVDSSFSDVLGLWSIESEIDAVVKGVKVLSHCGDAPQKVYVGIPKTLIAKLIEKRAAERIKWLAASIKDLNGKDHNFSPYEKKKMVKILDDFSRSQSEDLETWLIIGRTPIHFPSMPEDSVQILTSAIKVQSDQNPKIILIRPKGEIATKTASTLIRYLATQGFYAEIRDVSEAIIWECSTLIGPQIGNVHRFSIDCGFSKNLDGIDPITANGMAPREAIADIGAKLILDRFVGH